MASGSWPETEMEEAVNPREPDGRNIEGVASTAVTARGRLHSRRFFVAVPRDCESARTWNIEGITDLHQD
jgi:hypothetical protein